MAGYTEDIEAINQYFHRYDESKLSTESLRLRKDWDSWYRTLTVIDKFGSKAAWLEARKRRDVFNLSLGMKPIPGAITSEDIWPNGPPGSTAGEIVYGTAEGAKVVANTTGKTLQAVANYFPLIILIGGAGVLWLYASPFLPKRSR